MLPGLSGYISNVPTVLKVYVPFVAICVSTVSTYVAINVSIVCTGFPNVFPMVLIYVAHVLTQREDLGRGVDDRGAVLTHCRADGPLLPLPRGPRPTRATLRLACHRDSLPPENGSQPPGTGVHRKTLSRATSSPP